MYKIRMRSWHHLCTCLDSLSKLYQATILRNFSINGSWLTNKGIFLARPLPMGKYFIKHLLRMVDSGVLTRCRIHFTVSLVIFIMPFYISFKNDFKTFWSKESLEKCRLLPTHFRKTMFHPVVFVHCHPSIYSQNEFGYSTLEQKESKLKFPLFFLSQ